MDLRFNYLFVTGKHGALASALAVLASCATTANTNLAQLTDACSATGTSTAENQAAEPKCPEILWIDNTKPSAALGQVLIKDYVN